MVWMVLVELLEIVELQGDFCGTAAVDVCGTDGNGGTAAVDE